MYLGTRLPILQVLQATFCLPATTDFRADRIYKKVEQMQCSRTKYHFRYCLIHGGSHALINQIRIVLCKIYLRKQNTINQMGNHSEIMLEQRIPNVYLRFLSITVAKSALRFANMDTISYRHVARLQDFALTSYYHVSVLFDMSSTLMHKTIIVPNRF